MEVRFMDKHFNTTKIVDAYISCIWTESYIGCGDFELVLPMTYSTLSGITLGSYASIRESTKYMIVEGINIQTTIEDGSTLIVTGRSLESLLINRIIRKETTLTGNLQTGVLRLLNANAIFPRENKRNIQGLVFKESIDPDITKLELDLDLLPGDNLYDAIYVICDCYKIGFRINPLENGMMEFELYSGKDRSYSQTELPWVVFSPKYENLKESNLVMDSTGLKTVIFSDVTYKRQSVNDSGEEIEVEETVSFEIGAKDSQDLNRKEIYKEIRSMNIEEVDIAQFGAATDRVNIRDFQSWEPVYFNRDAYEEALKKWQKRVDDARPQIKKESQEWNSYWKDGSADPGWQEAHPDEPPFYWVLETVPGDSAKEIANKWEYYDRVVSSEPNKEDFMRYGWVLTDPEGYDAALRAAQLEINAEFEAEVADKVETAKKQIEAELENELAQYASVTTFTGDVDSNVQFIFGRDYYLGDIVQIVNAFDIQAVTRVSGMQFSQDSSNGFVMQPTFVSDDEAVFEL